MFTAIALALLASLATSARADLVLSLPRDVPVRADLQEIVTALTDWSLSSNKATPRGLDIRQSPDDPEVALPPDPAGYEGSFGPLEAALNAPVNTYMGFLFLGRYNVRDCANICNARDADPVGGACKYFNIWRAVLNGTESGVVCAMYSDEFVHLNNDPNNIGIPPELTIRYSRGYQRKTRIHASSNFKSFNCPGNAPTCSALTHLDWAGTSQGAVIFRAPGSGHSSNASLRIGGGVDGQMQMNGVVFPANAGELDTLQFFYRSTGQALLDVIWNGALVKRLVGPQDGWVFEQVQVQLLGDNDDTLSFGQGSAEGFSFVDDIFMFKTTS